MGQRLNREEKILLGLLDKSFGCGGEKPDRRGKDRTGCDRAIEPELRSDVLAMAKKHAVMSFLYDVCEKRQDFTDEEKKEMQQAARVVALSNYRLWFLTKYVVELLGRHEISTIVLKGIATASCYPVPELRKAGDVDILITDAAQFGRACEILIQDGFVKIEEQTAHHHVELKNAEGISVEVHGSLAEEFESGKMNTGLNRLLAEYGEYKVKNSGVGFSFYQPADAYHAFYLVLHMLQHYLRAGFGLKFLCDWVVFFNRDVEAGQKEKFAALCKEHGVYGFVRVMTAACVKYLGLRRENVSFLLDGADAEEEMVEAFLKDIFDGGEFGRDDETRMVAMRGAGFFAYVREFHHQMHLNFPRAGGIFILWPFLWCATLVRFLYNNKKVRKVSGREILKAAGERSRLVYRMKLFR